MDLHGAIFASAEGAAYSCRVHPYLVGATAQGDHDLISVRVEPP
jgi:hypothetical protein